MVYHMHVKTVKSNTAVVWGEDPAVSGPRNWFRHSRMIRELTSRVKKGSYILDAGCGGGELIIRLGKMGYHSVGIDGAPGCVSYSNTCIQKEGLKNLVLARRADIMHIPYADRTFDAVMCGDVLEHIDADAKAARELMRVMKPGGYLILTVPADPSAWDEVDDISSHCRRYSKEMLTTLLEDSGASVVLCKNWGFPLNELWHRYLFLPFIRQKIAGKANVTSSRSLRSLLMKSSLFKQSLALLFSFDNLFDMTNKGKAFLCVAQRKKAA